MGRQLHWVQTDIPRERFAAQQQLKAQAELYPGRICVENILREIDHGELSAWFFVEDGASVIGIVVVRIIDYEAGMRSMRFEHFVGDLEIVEEFLPAFEDLARRERCDQIEIQGRKGWERVLDGYREVSRTIAKEL